METDNNMWSKVYKKRDEIVSREIAGETILVPIKGKLADMQRIFALEKVSEYIWQRIDGNTSVNEIVTCVTDAFEVDTELAKADILNFIDELVEADLILEATAG